MGSLNAQEFAAAVGEGEISMRMALNWHLTANMFPPVHTVFVDSAMAAIRLVADEDYDTEVELPGSRPSATAVSIVEDLRLWDFIYAADAIPPMVEESHQSEGAT